MVYGQAQLRRHLADSVIGKNLDLSNHHESALCTLRPSRS